MNTFFPYLSRSFGDTNSNKTNISAYCVDMSKLDELKDFEKLQTIPVDKLRDVLLDYLEQKVGVRDMSWNLSKPTYYEEKQPMMSPLYANLDTCTIKDARIFLTKCAEGDPEKRLFQMSHEVVHLLNPTPNQVSGGSASNFEEGIATWFSIHVCEHLVPDYTARGHVLRDGGGYKKQFELIDELTKLNPIEPLNVVKKIRDEGYTMQNIKPDVLSKHTGETYSPEDIDFLLAKFN